MFEQILLMNGKNVKYNKYIDGYLARYLKNIDTSTSKYEIVFHKDISCMFCFAFLQILLQNQEKEIRSYINTKVLQLYFSDETKTIILK